MYSAEDYILFFLAVILFFGVLALLGAIIEHRENRQAWKKYQEENRQFFRAPKRQGRSYVQEWDEILEKRKGGAA